MIERKNSDITFDNLHIQLIFRLLIIHYGPKTIEDGKTNNADLNKSA